MTADQVRDLLRAACDKAGSQSNWAKSAGLSPAYVSDVLAGKREPGPKVLRVLGVVVTAVYRKGLGEQQ